MKHYLICLCIVGFYGCANNSDPSATTLKDSPSKHSNDSIQMHVPPQKDFHTTYADVIENLFVFINKQDWNTANSFYADSADGSANGSFFQLLFHAEKLRELERLSTSKIDSGIYVRTVAKKVNGQVLSMCFLFRIDSNNKLTDQQITACNNQ